MKDQEMIEIEASLRLRKPQTIEWRQALEWYNDADVLWFSERIKGRGYSLDEISDMYTYLSTHGNLYFIEVLENGQWVAIGDANYSPDTLPIVIGNKAYWGKGIGKKVIKTFIDLAKAQGLKSLRIKGIYHDNNRAKALFESLGFKPVSQKDQATSYRLDL